MHLWHSHAFPLAMLGQHLLWIFGQLSENTWHALSKSHRRLSCEALCEQARGRLADAAHTGREPGHSGSSEHSGLREHLSRTGRAFNELCHGRGALGTSADGNGPSGQTKKMKCLGWQRSSGAWEKEIWVEWGRAINYNLSSGLRVVRRASAENHLSQRKGKQSNSSCPIPWAHCNSAEVCEHTSTLTHARAHTFQRVLTMCQAQNFMFFFCNIFFHFIRPTSPLGWFLNNYLYIP